MTVVNPKSISGINSITMASGSDNLLTIHSNNTTERVRVDSSGNLTATSFSGDGSSLTGVASTENIRTNTNATFLQNVNVSGTCTIGGEVGIGTTVKIASTGLRIELGAGRIGRNFGIGRSTVNNLTTGYGNIAIGQVGLSSVTDGFYNIGIGEQAGELLTTGNKNTVVGHQALRTATGAANNIAIGYDSLEQTTTGSQNTAVGNYSLDANTTADNNTGIGYYALLLNTTGANNTAVGAYALDANTTGTQNDALGYGAMGANTTGNYNAAFGSLAAVSLNGGNRNTFCGNSAGSGLTSGSDNTFLGYKAGNSTTTADNNVAIGKEALYLNTTGAANVAIGREAAHDQTTGSNNVHVGYYAGGFRTGGDNNVGVGQEAGRGASTSDPATGSNNTCVGRGAGEDIRSGDYNLLLGANAGKNASPSGTIGTQDGIVVLGDNNISEIYCADTSISNSDSRDKTDVNDFTKGLDWIKALRPVTYRWDRRTWYGTDEEPFGTPDGSKKKNKLHIGFLAQEALAVEQANGYGNSRDDMIICNLTEDESSYGMKYERLVPVLVNAIKELSEKNIALETRLNNAGIAT